jgi:hypothetical protein
MPGRQGDSVSESFNMFPSLAAHNVRNGVAAHIESTRKFWLRRAVSVLGANGSDIVSSQFGSSVSLPTVVVGRIDPNVMLTDWLPGSSPHDNVVHVLGMCSEKQMGGIAARRVVARMADFQSFWDWSVDLGPGESMGPDYAVSRVYHTVPVVVTRSCPGVATRWASGLVHSFAKRFSDLVGGILSGCHLWASKGKRWCRDRGCLQHPPVFLCPQLYLGGAHV